MATFMHSNIKTDNTFLTSSRYNFKEDVLLPAGSSSHCLWRKLPTDPTAAFCSHTLSLNYFRLQLWAVVRLGLKELQPSNSRAGLSVFVKELFFFFFFLNMKHRATTKQLNKTTDKPTDMDRLLLQGQPVGEEIGKEPDSWLAGPRYPAAPSTWLRRQMRHHHWEDCISWNVGLLLELFEILQNKI